MVVGIENKFDRFVSGFADGGDHILGFLGEVGIDNCHIVLKNHPDVVAAAKGYRHVSGADGRITEKDAGGHFYHIVEFHGRNLLFLNCLCLLDFPADPCCQNAAG